MNDEQFREDFNLGDPKPRTGDQAPGFKRWTGDLITEPGAYRGVPNERYHGAEICSSASISGTGLKVLSGDKSQRRKGQTPRHFFETSFLNPNRKPKKETDALRVGRAFHDALLLPDEFADRYHRLPEGFSRAASKKFADEIAAADEAIADGLACLSVIECALIDEMVAALRADALVAPLISEGEAEVTLAWKDEETGVWLRARPDWIRPSLDVGLNFKSDADASFDGFSRSIAKFGYAQGAALELDGCLAVFGAAPTTYLHPVIEKPSLATFEPGDYLATAVWELPAEDIERGRWLNRQAIRLFADCLAADKWHGYTAEPEPCGLPSYARFVIDQGGAAEPLNDTIGV